MGNIYHSVHFFDSFHSVEQLKRNFYTHKSIDSEDLFLLPSLSRAFSALLRFNLQKHFPFFPIPTTISQLIVLYDWKIFLLDTIDGTLETDTET